MSDVMTPRRGRPPRIRPMTPITEADEAQAQAFSDALDEGAAPPVQPSRPPLRQAMRDDDPRARAARRAAEIRGDGNLDMDNGSDRFHIPEGIVPDGWSYEWKRKLLVGKPDPSYEVELQRGGWEPVPASRHRHLMPAKGTWETIEMDGMVLMERPKEITDERQRANQRAARDQVRAKEAQLREAAPGQFERDRPTIRKNYEAIPVPADDGAAA